MQPAEMNELNEIPLSSTRDIERILRDRLDRCGLYYRLFGRVKTKLSIIKKIDNKKYSENRKMQDLLGFRIALYFKDDISICRQTIKDIFVVDNESVDSENVDLFKPNRLNIVCKIPEEYNMIDQTIFSKYPIDNTFEIQIRTVFSEGWHEVEHDLRYKCQPDWEPYLEYSRALNGILATLETCDWAIVNLFDNLSYRHYKNQDWKAMITNKLRIRLSNPDISPDILDIFNNNQEIAKQFCKIDREEFILFLAKSNIKIPLTINNIIYAINGLYIHAKLIEKLAPEAIMIMTKK